MLSETNILGWSGGEAGLFKHVQLRARRGFDSDRGLLLDHLHLSHHGMRHGTADDQSHIISASLSRMYNKMNKRTHRSASWAINLLQTVMSCLRGVM